MRKGLELGICQPGAILNGYENTYVQHIVEDVEKSVFWKPFLQKPFSITDDEWKSIREEGRKAIQQDAVGGFRKIRTFFDKEYLPKTRTSIGVSHFPNGLQYYQERTRHFTSTDMPYETIYQLGSSSIPFGGIGTSGHGGHLGKFSFDTFTHYKGIVKKVNWFEPFFRYPPFSKSKLRLWRLALGRK